MKTSFSRYFIAAVWIINGLLCKVLMLVPRHAEIVARILGESYAQPLTVFIGLLETALGAWIIFDRYKKLTAVLQLILIFAMNIIEFILVPDLLLFGRFNMFIAFAFMVFIYWNAFRAQDDKALL